MSGEAGAVGSVVLNAPVKCCFCQNKLIPNCAKYTATAWAHTVLYNFPECPVVLNSNLQRCHSFYFFRISYFLVISIQNNKFLV